MEFNKYLSKNFDKKKRPKNFIKLIIIHYTGMQSERESLLRLSDEKSKVSTHYLINRVGKIYSLVKDNRVAWHAGVSRWGKYKNLNKNSIGIELVNKGHEFGYTTFSKKQIKSLIKICKNLIKKYKINNKNIIGHSDIAPLRKIDPGEKFPWEILAKNNIGIWHTCEKLLLKKLRNNKKFSKKDKINFFKDLKKIGYFINYKNTNLILKTLKAFQRHHRKILINGKIDKECMLIAQNLSKNL